jgi:DNA-binding transcriptional ArsR family regulator
MRNQRCAIDGAGILDDSHQLVRNTVVMAARPELHDPRVLRAIAHPVRSRILTELDASGSLRAADVAARLGIPANSASFHLRQLAKFGLVEEDPEGARDKRDRVWKATQEDGYNISLNEVEQAPGGKAASAVFRRTKAAWSHRLVDLAYGDDRTPGVHRAVTEQALRLTKEESEQLVEELTEVIEVWRRRNQGHADDGRSTYHVFQIVQPFPDHELDD